MTHCNNWLEEARYRSTISRNDNVSDDYAEATAMYMAVGDDFKSVKEYNDLDKLVKDYNQDLDNVKNVADVSHFLNKYMNILPNVICGKAAEITVYANRLLQVTYDLIALEIDDLGNPLDGEELHREIGVRRPELSLAPIVNYAKSILGIKHIERLEDFIDPATDNVFALYRVVFEIKFTSIYVNRLFSDLSKIKLSEDIKEYRAIYKKISPQLHKELTELVKRSDVAKKTMFFKLYIEKEAIRKEFKVYHAPNGDFILI